MKRMNLLSLLIGLLLVAGLAVGCAAPAAPARPPMTQPPKRRRLKKKPPKRRLQKRRPPQTMGSISPSSPKASSISSGRRWSWAPTRLLKISA
jgi:hypothetical protein